MNYNNWPEKQGLYDPIYEHDACGMGFVASIDGERSNRIIKYGLKVLRNLEHRGARGAEENTGDGAGILLQLPHEFLEYQCKKQGIHLPKPDYYGVGMVFLPRDDGERKVCEHSIEEKIRQEGQRFLGWREVPVRDQGIGNSARESRPVIKQLFIGRASDITGQKEFERRLYLLRKQLENEVEQRLYFTSLSSKTIVYKGMLTAHQLEEVFPDLNNPQLKSALVLIHSRFSTNTFPSWERAHPNRFIIHNGEINTLRGNINWMRARQKKFNSELFGDELSKLLPVIDEEGSDSAIFDNVFEFLLMTGHSPAEAIMMMIPEPWEDRQDIWQELQDFYHYHSCLMEPWDGPAAIAFTDGTQIGGVLDRNGLRPARYYVTRSGLVIMASEVGVLDLPPEEIVSKQRLEPGKMLLVDTEEKEIISNREIKQEIASRAAYGTWLKENIIKLDDPSGRDRYFESDNKLVKTQKIFAYSREEIEKNLKPMAEKGIIPVGSMGDDGALAVLAEKPQLLYNYFKQHFAQVTNPPIDSIREEIITSTRTHLGSEGNLLNPGPDNCRQLELSGPLLANRELAEIVELEKEGLKAARIPIFFNKTGNRALEAGMEAIFARAEELISAGRNILILSDRDLNCNQVPIPALLAGAGLHHHLIRQGMRTSVSIVLESGEPREIHHFSLLLGYGADAINPYLALDTISELVEQGILTEIKGKKARQNYLKAATKGVVKVMAKMGISTIQSYRGAQIFEALGINSSVIEKYFTGTPSRVEGIDITGIERETIARYKKAYTGTKIERETLESGSELNWRNKGEEHLFNPASIYKLQQACRLGNYQLFKEYSSLINHHSAKRATLRGLLTPVYRKNPLPLSEIEPVESILRRFKTGAMSYGSLSQEAHETLALAMNQIGAKSNSGEGGEDPSRYTEDDNGESRCSAIKQVASGRFGVNNSYLNSAREIQIKMAQGAKPGEGGQLPGRKVYPWIAKVRGTTPGVGLISPPPHHDIYSIEDLAQLIHDLKNANPEALINVKLVAEAGVGTIAAGVAKGKADVILISGYDGGTGASPRTSIRHAGLPWELGVSETHQTLVLNGLRDRVKIETDGKMMTGRDLAIAALLGAEEYGFATAPLVAMGCVMMRVCSQDTCPVGIATQNPELRKNFRGKPEYVVNFMRFIARELREEMAALGFRTLDQMIGRVDRLRQEKSIKNLDYHRLLYQPEVQTGQTTYHNRKQKHGLEKTLDRRQLLSLARPALEKGEKVEETLEINNIDRVVGTILGNEITKMSGEQGLKEDQIKFKFNGSAGQSFGAFIPRGLTLILTGDANDYIGKGLSGGKIAVKTPPEADYNPRANVIIGNVAFFGATAGEAYINGVAGERFCVRNSGIKAVVEGVGDHGCEYMTGGAVVILGKTGRNFAAGMTGGTAYILDEKGDFADRCNRTMVELSAPDREGLDIIKAMIIEHVRWTDSSFGREVLNNWSLYSQKFIRVLPRDYRRMLTAIESFRQRGMPEEKALMAAFEQNRLDKARTGGN